MIGKLSQNKTTITYSTPVVTSTTSSLKMSTIFNCGTFCNCILNPNGEVIKICGNGENTIPTATALSSTTDMYDDDDTANEDLYWLVLIPAVCLVIIAVTVYCVCYKKSKRRQILMRAHYNVTTEHVTFGATSKKTTSAIPISSVWGLNLLHIIPVMFILVMTITLYFVCHKKHKHAQLSVRALYNVTAETDTYSTTSKGRS